MTGQHFTLGCMKDFILQDNKMNFKIWWATFSKSITIQKVLSIVQFCRRSYAKLGKIKISYSFLGNISDQQSFSFQEGPPVAEMITILGKEETLKRLKYARETLSLPS